MEENLVFAVTPISYTDNFKTRIIADDILPIELYDTPENIFSRLVFRDESDNVYTDDDYKEEHRDYYLEDIKADLDWYGAIYAEIGIQNRVFINNDLPEVDVVWHTAEKAASTVSCLNRWAAFTAKRAITSS